MCVGAFSEWVPLSSVADEAPPLWTGCLYGLISLPINLSFPVYILLFHTDHDYKGFSLCTPTHVNNVQCNLLLTEVLLKVLFPILFGSLPIFFIYAGSPLLCHPVPSDVVFSQEASPEVPSVAFVFSLLRPSS